MTDFPTFSKHTDMPSDRRNMKENSRNLIKAGRKIMSKVQPSRQLSIKIKASFSPCFRFHRII